MHAESSSFVFKSGTLRFDASGNLFVNLPHKPADPQPVRLGDELRSISGDEKRSRIVLADAGSAVTSGEFSPVDKLQRGHTVSFQGYTSATLGDDGALRVEVPGGAELPGWATAGAEHIFERDGEPLCLWAKSSLPEGVSRLGEEPAHEGCGCGGGGHHHDSEPRAYSIGSDSKAARSAYSSPSSSSSASSSTSSGRKGYRRRAADRIGCGALISSALLAATMGALLVALL